MIRSLLLLAFITLFIAGCSTTKLFYEDSNSYVDSLVKQKEFAIALRHIEKLNKKDPDYRRLQKRRPQILKQLTAYEQLTLTKSRKLEQAEKWSQAVQLLQKALKHIPESKILLQELQRVESERSEEIAQVEYQITLHKARSIRDGQDLYKQLYQLDSDRSLAPEIVQQRARVITDELLKLAKAEVAAKETIKSRNLLKLAGEVDPEIRRSPEFRKLLRQIEEIEKGITRAIKKKREIEQERQIKAYKILFKQNNFIEAQIALKQIEKQFKNSKPIRKLRRQLNKSVSNEIKKHMEKGQTFYSKEQLEYAIREWGHVLLLEPNNQVALEQISRAVKVLEKLQNVRNNQQR
ncbi:MAG: hypothetical protein OQK78_00215 [Gammaproteobacteria bacterium]|nr:hypothetical protein [Gammaproteobacteria bacterium]